MTIWAKISVLNSSSTFIEILNAIAVLRRTASGSAEGAEIRRVR